MNQLPNFLTLDLEEWYRVNYEGADAAALSCAPGWMERLTDKLLEICDEAGCRSTFFVLGSVAEDCPEVVRRIAAAGHEVASHGCAHKAVFSMTPGEFEEDLRRSCGILEFLTGKAVRGFRAPSFSVRRETLPWFYDTLERAGLAYSSSVFPGRTFLYGIPDFPYRVHRPVIEGRQTGITEFPVTRLDFAGKTIGLYVRMFPASFLRYRIRRENAAGRPAMLYVHPREIDPDQPRLPLPRMQSFIHYFGVRGCERKLRRLLRTAPGPFLSIGDAIGRFPRIFRVRGDVAKVALEFQVRTTGELKPQEIAELTRLFEVVFGKPCPEELFQRKFGHSRLGHSIHSLMFLDGELIGAFSAIPVRYRFFGRTLLFAITADLMIDPSQRGPLSRVQRLAEGMYETLAREGVAFVFCCLRREIFQLHQAVSNWREIGKVCYYVAPFRPPYLARIWNLFSRRSTEATSFEIEKVNDAEFAAWRYKIFPANYLTVNLPGGSAIYATELYYPIEGIPRWVHLGLLIDVFPLTKTNFDAAVLLIRWRNPQLTVLAYQGILPFRTNDMIRIPAKCERQSWTLAGRILDPEQVDERVFDPRHWNINLSNGDLV